MYGPEKASSLRLQWASVFDGESIEFLSEKVKNKPTLRKIEELPPREGMYCELTFLFLLFPQIEQIRGDVKLIKKISTSYNIEGLPTGKIFVQKFLS